MDQQIEEEEVRSVASVEAEGVLIERWSDGSVFITGVEEGPEGQIAFAAIGRENQEDARKWLEAALRGLRLIREDS